MLLVVAGSYGIVSAQKPAVILNDKTGWHKIATATVDLKKERDEIAVLAADRFASIKFIVKDAAIDLRDLEVYYESGDIQKATVGAAIKAPGESRVIELNGGERNLKKVVFIYKTVPNYKDEKAHIELWGLKTNTETKK